jgi:hypothetical protein
VDRPNAVELLYVSIHASEAIKAGLAEDNSFSEDEHRTLLVYNDWVKQGRPSPSACYRAWLVASGLALNSEPTPTPPLLPRNPISTPPLPPLPRNPIFTPPPPLLPENPISNTPFPLPQNPIPKLPAAPSRVNATADAADVMKAVFGHSTVATDVSDAVASSSHVELPSKPTRSRAPRPTFNKLTHSKREEILAKMRVVYKEFADYAAENHLNPVEVNRYAFAGALKSSSSNSWRAFQLLRGMVRQERKLLFLYP